MHLTAKQPLSPLSMRWRRRRRFSWEWKKWYMIRPTKSTPKKGRERRGRLKPKEWGRQREGVRTGFLIIELPQLRYSRNDKSLIVTVITTNVASKWNKNKFIKTAHGFWTSHKYDKEYSLKYIFLILKLNWSPCPGTKLGQYCGPSVIHEVRKELGCFIQLQFEIVLTDLHIYWLTVLGPWKTIVT